jgi:hypothetical protein
MLVILAAAGLSIFCSVYWASHSPTLKNLRGQKALQDFSGEYYMGYYWSWHLSIKTDNSFILEILDDMGGQRNYTGSVLVENNIFRLITSDENFSEPTELFPVKWGQRRYIITADMVDNFCYDVSQGWEPREFVIGGPFYLQENDWEKPARWIPVSLNGFPFCSVPDFFMQ